MGDNCKTAVFAISPLANRSIIRALALANIPFAARDFGGFQGTNEEHIAISDN